MRKRLVLFALLLVATPFLLAGAVLLGVAVGVSQLAVLSFLVADILFPVKKIRVPLLGGFTLILQREEV